MGAHKNRLSTSLLSSKDTMANENKNDASTTTPLNILALHGSGGTAWEFPEKLQSLRTALLEHGVETEITAISAPFVKENGFSWWTMPPGVRSFNATEYIGFEESKARFLEACDKAEAPFDLVVGHSQGAILVASLLALEGLPYHPRAGYILNGVSFPNPYKHDLELLAKGADAATSAQNPRILFVLGKKDQIAPNTTGEKLREALGACGFGVSSCYHEGGHGFPRDETTVSIAEWIREGL